MSNAAHASSDIWHHSLEDLLKAIETGESGAACPAAAYAIHLHTSITPIGMPGGTFPRFEKLHIYQLSHPGNGAAKHYQLRLGIIESELEADAILATVRRY